MPLLLVQSSYPGASPRAAETPALTPEGAASRPRSYDANVALSGIDHVVISVSNWERSNRFYSDVVGTELVALPRGRYAYLRNFYGAPTRPGQSTDELLV